MGGKEVTLSRPFRSRRKATNRPLWLILIAFALSVGWGVGLFLFADSIPLSVDDETTRTDAIVVLTGGSGRLDKGLDLMARKMATKLFVSGVYHGIDVRRLLELSQRAPAELECCIEIGHDANNTAGNAAEAAAWMQKNGFNSLRIVTSSYHMPRSLLEFTYLMPDVTIIPHPVFPDRVKNKQWWIWPGTSALIISEYNKYLVVWLRHISAILKKD